MSNYRVVDKKGGQVTKAIRRTIDIQKWLELNSRLESTSEQQNNRSRLNVEIENTTIQGSFEKFSNDFFSLLNDTSHSDVSIKSGTEDFKAHKIILSASSPVFKAMFSNSMRESVEGTISIDDLDPEIVRDLLSFIYCNQVQNLSVPKACDLLNAAEKYQLHSLKCICVDFLKSSLSVENAFIILQKADLYDEMLKTHTMKFISEKFSDLKVTEEWKSVKSRNPTLALEVFDILAERFT